MDRKFRVRPNRSVPRCKYVKTDICHCDSIRGYLSSSSFPLTAAITIITITLLWRHRGKMGGGGYYMCCALNVCVYILTCIQSRTSGGEPLSLRTVVPVYIRTYDTVLKRKKKKAACDDDHCSCLFLALFVFFLFCLRCYCAESAAVRRPRRLPGSAHCVCVTVVVVLVWPLSSPPRRHTTPRRWRRL